VGSVLEGSVRREGSRLRVAAKLLSVPDGRALWSETYDRELGDVFALQEGIAGAVARALRVKLLTASSSPLPRTTPDAYLQYLLGYQHWVRGNEGDVKKSVAAYERALALDPAYSPAWAGLAWSLELLSEDEPDLNSLLSMKRRASDAAERAVALGPAEGRAYYARGGLRAANRHEWVAGLADLEKAITLQGGDSAVYRVHGYILGALGRVPEAITSLNRATDLEPLAARGWVILGGLYKGTGQLDQARSAYQRALEVAPGHATAGCFLGHVHLLAGRPVDALSASRTCRGDGSRLVLTALAEHSMGHENESSEALRKLIETGSSSWAFQIAEVFAWRGERGAAFSWLTRADEQMDGGLMELKYSPYLRTLHSDPRWTRFLRKLNLPVD
jgi:serine/threonine-protein kinase